MSAPPKILFVCQGGNVRSVTFRFLANYKYGLDALACGWEPNTEGTKRMLYDWAEHIVVVQPEMLEKLPEDVRGKAIVFDIGEDRWFRSLDDDLVKVCDEFLQRAVAYYKEGEEPAE